MATKREVQKRRVQAQRQVQARARATARQDRRRRLVVGTLAGVVAVAMVASLGAGLLAGSNDPSTDAPGVADSFDPSEPAPDAVTLTPAVPGEALTGATPCPATDGSQVRTTAFESAPPVCIDPTVEYGLSMLTSEGPLTFDVDTTDTEAANVVVTNSRYGVYDDTPFWLVLEDGLVIVGGATPADTGFTVPAAGATRPYEVGDLLLWADADGRASAQLALVTGDTIAAILAEDPVHPIVGTLTGGTDVVDAIVDTAAGPSGLPVAEVRIGAVTVTEGQ